jgi:hypothetical protein
MVKCELMTTVPKELLSAKPLGPPLPPRRMREIERALLLAVGIIVPAPRQNPGTAG